MKILYGIAALFLVYGCSSHEPGTATTVSAYVNVYDTLIDQVKSQGGVRASRTSMEHVEWDKLPKADVNFVRQVMLRSENNNDTLPVDSLSVYHIFDFNDLDTVFLFSIARSDFSGYHSLYHFTLNKLKKRLSSCTLIGTCGNLERHTCNDKLTFAKDGKSLIANSNAEIKENGQRIIDQCSIRYDFYKDSTTSKLLHNVHREKPKKR